LSHLICAGLEVHNTSHQKRVEGRDHNLDGTNKNRRRRDAQEAEEDRHDGVLVIQTDLDNIMDVGGVEKADGLSNLCAPVLRCCFFLIS